MKTLEEIERLTGEELEQRAAASAPAAPEGLQRRLRTVLAAQEIASQAATQPRPARWAVPAAALACAAAAAVLLTLPDRGPRDTFDDPYLAYAEVEKAFQTISDKMSGGLDLAREARVLADKPQNILDNIQSK